MWLRLLHVRQQRHFISSRVPGSTQDTSELSYNKHGTQHVLGRAYTKTCTLTMLTRTRHHTCRVGQQLKRMPGRQPTQHNTKTTAQHSQELDLPTPLRVLAKPTTNENDHTTTQYKATTHTNTKGEVANRRAYHQQTNTPNAGVVGFSALLRAAQALGHAANTR